MDCGHVGVPWFSSCLSTSTHLIQVAPIPRPRSSPSSADLDAEIARVQREQEARITELTRRKRDAEAAENARRGHLVQQYLGGEHGPELRRALAAIVAPRDRQLFGIESEDRPPEPALPDR